MAPYHHAPPKPPPEVLCARQHEFDASETSERSVITPKDSLIENERCSSTQSSRNDEDKSGDETRPTESMPRKPSYVSAFRPVVKDTESIAKLYGNRGPYSGTRPGYLSPDFLSESSSYRSASPDVDDSAEDPDVDVESHKVQEDEERLLSVDEHHSPSATLSAYVHGDGGKGQGEENSKTVAMSDPHTTHTSEAEKQNKPLLENTKPATRYEVSAKFIIIPVFLNININAEFDSTNLFTTFQSTFEINAYCNGNTMDSTFAN